MEPTTSQRALGEMCGWEGKSAQARIGNYENGVREPSIDDLKKIARALGTSVAHLIGEEPTHPNQSELMADYALIPQYSAKGAAGNGFENAHVEVKGELVFKVDWLRRMHLRAETLHVIYVSGDSMEPTINDGDVVLIDGSQVTPEDGQIYAIRRPDGELIIKRLMRNLPSGWIIASDNPLRSHYYGIETTDSEMEQLQIVGKAVWHAGEL